NVLATGHASNAFGAITKASGNYSTSMGEQTIASGESSVAMGALTIASGDLSIAMGFNSKALGVGSNAFGLYTNAAASSSTTMGYRLRANGFASTVIGIYNDALIPLQIEPNNSTPLFIIGNGNSHINRSNALTVYKNGEVEINDAYTLPTSDGDSNQVISTDGNGNLTWSKNSGVFEQYQDDIRFYNGYDSLNFIVGSPQMNDDGISNHDKRMFFNKEKGAFRVGETYNENWDNDSLGDHSFASGYVTKAKGRYSTATGGFTEAKGEYSTATGNASESSGFSSFAAGQHSNSSGSISMAMGNGVEASGFSSVAMGEHSKSSGPHSFAMGYYTEAIGYASVALNNRTKASAKHSTTTGFKTISNGYASTVIGMYNDTIVPVQNTGSNSTPLFIVGNGNSNFDRSNALTVYGSGEVEINDVYTLPSTDGDSNQVMTTDGNGKISWENAPANAVGNDVFENNSGDIRLVSGHDTANYIFGSPQMNHDGNNNHRSRMFFNKEKGAFRAGETAGTSWDEDSIGNNSFATGFGTKAIGEYSTAMGRITESTGFNSTALGYKSKAIGIYSSVIGAFSDAYGDYSLAMGNSSEAFGDNSIAMGRSSEAMGDNSTAIGYFNSAKGKYSISMGRSNISNGYSSLVIGMFNDTVVPVQTGHSSSTPLLIIGNGSGSGSRSNAMVVQKNGNVGIGINTPDEKLHVDGKLKFGSFETIEDGGTSRIATNCAIVPTNDDLYDLGSSTKRWDDIYATNGVIQTSDTTLKTNITPLSYGLNELMKIETISYQWKGDKFGTTKIGFNAQNLQTIIPEVVIDEEEVIDEETGEATIIKTDKLGVHYSDMIPVLTKSIQEQQEIIKNQKAENQKQVEKNEIQENKIKAQSEELEKLKKEMVEMKKLLFELMKSTHNIEK
ncbi:MAG: tail fiber domain-containing protein, partial [Flavobacteriales bacterium]